MTQLHPHPHVLSVGYGGAIRCVACGVSAGRGSARELGATCPRSRPPSLQLVWVLLCRRVADGNSDTARGATPGGKLVLRRASRPRRLDLVPLTTCRLVVEGAASRFSYHFIM